MLERHLRRKIKLGLKIVSVFALLGFATVIILINITYKKYPKQVNHTPVNHAVSIKRDAFGIPNIQAKSNEDALVALGYVHAQERYWQMMITRETAKGHLAALVGRSQLDHDRVLRRLDLEQLAKNTYKNQTKLTKKYLTAYAKGVNLWVKTHEKDRLPFTVEQLFVDVSFEPWQPEDAILIQKYMAYHLSNKIDQSLTTMWFYQNLTEVQRSALLPNMKKTDESWPTIIKFIHPSGMHKQSGASNVFSVAAKNTKKGASIFAADPHLELFAPSQWFLTSLTWDGHHVSGATIPGIPLVLNGRNPYLVWGQTITGLDDQDISLIAPKEKNNQTIYHEKPVQIAIKGEEAYHDHIQMTKLGPVFDPSLFGVTFKPAYELVLQWTGFNEHDQAYPFGWGLMSAKSIKQAFKKSNQIVAPAQNFIVADKLTSRLMMVGQIPKRSALQPSQGRSPGFYHNPKEHWEGVMPVSQNLSFNPDIKGYLINTNNAITTKPFPQNITFNWIDDYRIKRAEKLIRVNHKQTLADIKATQLDTTSEKALWVSSLLLYHLKKADIQPRYYPVIDALKAWQGDMVDDHFEPLVYTLWLDYFLADILSPLGENWIEAERLNPRFTEQLLKSPEHYTGWCQNDCQKEITLAFEKTMNQLSYLYGHDHDAWRWGRYHHALHLNPVLNEIPIIRWFANIDHSIGGDRETLAMAQAYPFSQKAHRGSGLRTIVDFSEPGERIHMILSTGQSGQITSLHYSDQNKLWRNGKYLTYDPNTTKTKKVTVLKPE